ncbi:MAG TPA: dTDP-glucose 4,6-dehydratase [Candidatus Hydrogenedens sp.]|mgnify:CR=1 FL=1|nr:dTDP-glucose 4,6-dehydratase [Candidatus Hydrogenedens sp.]HOL19189.1 dTDP-glucose 4,6-dehydratase [Candidatus Hydrogenedens sp.]HPP58405.1 dTDP-glucose 4,6-dehydratase [Candidatus Hydrogenedens sp.]
MKKILVTGGAGFIGSAFIRNMLAWYPDLSIVNLDKLTYAGNLDNLRGIDESRYTFIRGDIADADTVERAIESCDAVVNFAAETHVDRSLMGAKDFLKTNVEGVYQILITAQKKNVSRVLLVSTDEVYGSRDKGSATETDLINPRNPYSASKAGGELLGKAFFESFKLPVLITRGCNTYGPYQYPEKVLPLFITNAIENKPLPLYKGGEHNVRDWLYVDDHCRAIDTVLREGTPGEIYNISAGFEKENIEITRKVLELTGKDEALIQWLPDRPGHDYRYSMNSAKLRALGWAPSVNWEEGIQKTVRWYKENEWWWRKIKEGEFKKYYEEQYISKMKLNS